MKRCKTTFKAGFIFVLMAFAALSACDTGGNGDYGDYRDHGDQEEKPAVRDDPVLMPEDVAITVEWAAISGVTEYTVFWADSEEGDALDPEGIPVPGSDDSGTGILTATIPNLTNGETYWVWVNAGESTIGKKSCKLSPPLTVAVERVYNNDDEDRIKVSWTANDQAAAYRVYWSTEADKPAYPSAQCREITNNTETTVYISRDEHDPALAYNVWVEAVYQTGSGETPVSEENEPPAPPPPEMFHIASPSEMFHTVSDAAALAAAGAALNGSKVVSHTVTVNGNILAGAPINVSDAGTPGKTVSISGPPEGNAAITLGADGESLLNIRGCRVIMGGNLTLDGNGSQVVVNIAEGGTFSMSGGEIKGGLWYGVYIVGGGTFSMSGGDIYGNSESNVIVYNGGFTMSGGKIHDSNNFGVIMAEGSFTMTGGEIYDNYEVGVDSWPAEGSPKLFTMGGGDIYGNGTGVRIEVGAEFNMTRGRIHENSGHGVDVPNGTFSMSGGEIYDNSGCGVEVPDGTFSMSGGEISYNNNAGVYIWGGGTFSMSSGDIHHNNNAGVRVNSSFHMAGGNIRDNIFQDSDSNYYNPGNLILWENCQSAVKTGGTINGGIYISGEDYIPKQEWTDDFSYPEQ